jgi:hypothetical protein
MKTIAQMTATMIAKMTSDMKTGISPVLINLKELTSAAGIFATIPANMMSDMPLPIPAP